VVTLPILPRPLGGVDLEAPQPAHETANTLAVVVLSLRLQPWVSPLSAETMFVGARPNGRCGRSASMDAQGEFAAPVAIPNTPALRYAEAWLTSVFVDPLPLRTSVPIGGPIL
jgi:hypothetical protein